MTTQHTPGPWEVIQSDRIDRADRVIGENGMAVASVYATNIPDVRLMVAAPQMLAMLHEVIALLNNPDADGTDANRVERQILAVSAKATGEKA
jgi:hypothetical protein